jgi:ribonuclease R
MKKKNTKAGKSTQNWQRQDPQFASERDKYERPVPSRELILRQLAERGSPAELADLYGVFDLREPQDQEALRKRLGAMIRDGQLVQNRTGAYGLTTRMDLVHGSVIGHRDGYGFLKPDDGADDVFLSPRQMRSLLHGDRALVRITGTDHKGRREGSLVDVLERRNTRVVGRYTEEHGIGLVMPDNARISQDILIPPADRAGARPGQIVTAEIVQAPDKRSQPIGRIVEVLGEHMAPGMEIDIAIRSHGLPHEWPAEVEREIAGFSEEVPEAQKRDRLDLRQMALVTIDGADARDFDDAVFAEPQGKGWRLWVAIADVSAYVKPGAALDQEAELRGTSVYFPGSVIPMLPEILSNGLCSLKPQVDRLCLVCEMQVSPQGQVSGARFHNAVMRSQARLTYDQVALMITDEAEAGRLGHAKLLPHLRNLQAVFQALFIARQRRGAIDFETVETKIQFGPDRKIEDVVPVMRNEAHRIIEECMIAANVQAAQFLADHKLTLLYRVHAGPEADRLEILRSFLKEIGLSLGGGASPEPQHYAKLLQGIKERPDARLIQTVLLRSLAQAVYTPENLGHFGLALECYAHFTSPIRRYPDLLVHRAIKHVLAQRDAGDFPYAHEKMQSLGIHCSATERRADEATRDAVSWLKCEFMTDHVGEEFDGLITGVTPFGLFVEIERVYAEGLVHVSSLPNDYYHHEPAHHRLRGERSGCAWHLADKIRVRVLRVNLDERKIDFEPVGLPSGQTAQKSSQGHRQNQGKGRNPRPPKSKKWRN